MLPVLLNTMSYILKKFFWCFLLIGNAGVCSAQYNLESCYAFWKITDQLQQSVQPTQAAWDSLKLTAGYSRMPLGGDNWKNFVEKVKLVFAPNASMPIGFEKDPEWVRILTYKQKENELKQYAKDLQDLKLLDSAILQMQLYIPVKHRKNFKAPVIYFVLYNYDGARIPDNTIAVDLLISYDIDRNKGAVFTGHEVFHHAMAYCRVKTKHFKNVPQQYQAAFLAINSISEEGTADAIDKDEILFGKGDCLIRDTLLWMYKNLSAANIMRMDTALQQLAEGNTSPYADYNYWSKEIMPAVGHIPGMYMMHVIRRNGYMKQLIQNVDNPFYFFLLYNMAAKKDPEHPPVFSEKSIRFLKWMDGKYR